MEEREIFDEYRPTSTFRSWVILLVFAAGIVAWGLIILSSVRDAPRRWDFGTLPDTPAQTIYNTQEPDLRLPVPKLVQPVPGVKPGPLPPRETTGGRR